MRTIRIEEATERQIDYLVAKEEGRIVGNHCYVTPGDGYVYAEGVIPDGVISAPESVFDVCINALGYSTDYNQGMPILEREKIALDWDHDIWNAAKYGLGWYISGPTMLIAGLRCFLVSRLGDVVEVPEELV